MNVTENVRRTRTVTNGVSHGPITRSDPNRSDPAHMQLHGSPSIHDVTYVTRETATAWMGMSR